MTPNIQIEKFEFQTPARIKQNDAEDFGLGDQEYIKFLPGWLKLSLKKGLGSDLKGGNLEFSI